MAYLILFICSVGIVFTGPLRSVDQGESKSIYYAPPQFFKYFSFGQNETMADTFWLRLVQDVDLCAKEFSDQNAKTREEEIDPVSQRIRCHKSWSFRMLDVITELAPKFRMPFAVGGVSLSVMLDDYEGATIIFDKAVRNFPNDWPILYRAAYHYLVDLNQTERAAELLKQAGQAGAPDWVFSLAARLYTNDGKRELGLSVLRGYLELLRENNNEKGVRIIEERIQRLEAGGDYQ